MKLDSIEVKPMNIVSTLMLMTAIRYSARRKTGFAAHYSVSKKSKEKFRVRRIWTITTMTI